MCGITTVYSLWSFSSWQLQNCSVEHNEMCTGKVTVLGKWDKTVGWYMGNCSATVGTYLTWQFWFEPRIFRLRDLTIYFGIQIGVDIYKFWLLKFVLEGLRDIASKRRDISGCCLWDPLLDHSNCYNSTYGILLNNAPQDIYLFHIWYRWRKLSASPCTVWFRKIVGTFKK